MKIEAKIDDGELCFRIIHPGVPDTWTADIFSLTALALRGIEAIKHSGFKLFTHEQFGESCESFFAINTCSCGVAGCGGFIDYQARLDENFVLQLTVYDNQPEGRVSIGLCELCEALKSLEDELCELILLNERFTCVYGCDYYSSEFGTPEFVTARQQWAQDKFVEILDDIQLIGEPR
jgi:hypothetical protein